MAKVQQDRRSDNSPDHTFLSAADPAHGLKKGLTRGERQYQVRYLKLLTGLGTLALVLILVGLLWANTQTQTRIGSIRDSWNSYAQDADPKGVLISEIRGYFGYGGFIHNFKNYVLRHDATYLKALHEQTDLLLSAMDDYAAGETDRATLAALAQIRDVVHEYARNAETVTSAVLLGQAPHEIDAQVRVNDAPAILALQQLERDWVRERRETLEVIAQSLTDGQSLVGSLGWLMAAMIVLVALLGGLIYDLVAAAYRGNDALKAELAARQQAQEQERKLSWAVEQSPASVLITDKQGVIEYANSQQLAMSGYRADELIGRRPSILKSGHTSEAAYREIWHDLGAGRPWSGVFKNLRKDGSHYWCATSLYPLKDERGAITNYIGIAEDITEKIQLDEQIAQVQKMEAVGILAGSVAHDFNNVLMTILGNAELIRMEAEDLIATPPSEAAGRDIDTSAQHVQIAAKRARALLQQLLAFARRKPGQPQRVEMVEALREVLELLEASLPPTVTLALDIEQGLEATATEIDPTAVLQIVMNLCQNASEALGAGGGHIWVGLHRLADAGPDATAPQALPEGAIGWLHLTVRDDGPGIAGHVLEQIFTPFFSTKPVGKGTGLGLAIVKSAVEEAGGTVTVTTGAGQGTEFILSLPEFIAPKPGEVIQVGPEGGQERVLLVDDDETLLYTVRRLLARLGYRVEAYSDPLAAAAAFGADPGRFDVLVTDLMMPGMQGDVLASQLQEHQPDLPVILISSYFADQADIADQAARGDGPAHVTRVEKPVDLMGLAKAMRLAVEGRD